ncbi:hypothetical protein WOLCODRAFT_155022 [Wolfiporia cocos MD-104 SS10]|uniref:Uncharacterized protein n=1 Tax=Wolfiporia cocos (strain MD-104) TaxID=742152 RepID=A0A2H3K1E5_WOLCO|nr:hypothetical protein WOLCODRAFT_155022 [Wolfiporia cocos MD-104 SS10]
MRLISVGGRHAEGESFPNGEGTHAASGVIASRWRGRWAWDGPACDGSLPGHGGSLLPQKAALMRPLASYGTIHPRCVPARGSPLPFPVGACGRFHANVRSHLS